MPEPVQRPSERTAPTTTCRQSQPRAPRRRANAVHDFADARASAFPLVVPVAWFSLDQPIDPAADPPLTRSFSLCFRNPLDVFPFVPGTERRERGQRAGVARSALSRYAGVFGATLKTAEHHRAELAIGMS